MRHTVWRETLVAQGVPERNPAKLFTGTLLAYAKRFTQKRAFCFAQARNALRKSKTRATT